MRIEDEPFPGGAILAAGRWHLDLFDLNPVFVYEHTCLEAAITYRYAETIADSMDPPSVCILMQSKALVHFFCASV